MQQNISLSNSSVQIAETNYHEEINLKIDSLLSLKTLDYLTVRPEVFDLFLDLKDRIKNSTLSSSRVTPKDFTEFSQALLNIIDTTLKYSQEDMVTAKIDETSSQEEILSKTCKFLSKFLNIFFVSFIEMSSSFNRK